MRRKIWSVLAVTMALMISLTSVMSVGANPPAPDDVAPATLDTAVQSGKPVHSGVKNVDQPNAADFLRMRERQRLLEAGQTAEAAALAQTGDDRVLVVLVEFAGTDVFTWTEGSSTWDPIGQSNPAEWTGTVGDCSKIITQTQVFTYTGPMHNEIPRPVSVDDRSSDTIWTEDFNPGWFNAFMFGEGVSFDYTRDDGSVVHEDFTGDSVKNYFLDMSGGAYEIAGDVIGWVQVPHSTWYYDADECPGARSGIDGANPGVSRGAIPGAGTARTLVMDALDQVNAISNTIPGFDWANYDLDGNGVIDRLWIVHAGYGEEDGTTLINRTDYSEAAVWSHSSSVSPAYKVSDEISAGPYIIMPENGGIGVFAHEYAHNLGADDLYAYGNGETSTGFWALQADDWTGYPIGYLPPSPDPWHLDNWGWLNPVIVDDPAKEYVVTLGQTSEFPGGEGVYRGAKIVLPDGQLNLAVPLWQGDKYWWGGKLALSNSMMTLKNPVAVPAEGATLSFDLVYDIEDEWDFMWVQASEDGENWDTLTNANTQCAHDASWVGGEYGFPEDLCAAGIGGFYGYNANWPDPELQAFDLSAYAGKNVYLRFWYMTDWGTEYTGVFIDNVVVKSGETVLLTDNAESGGDNWTYQTPWQLSNGKQSFTHNFYLQWRNVGPDGGYDRGLGDPRFRFGPTNTGLLVWYNNNFYTDNEIENYMTDDQSIGPKGRMLVIDAHPEPYKDPNSPYVMNERGNVHSRSQMRDATFSQLDSVNFTVNPPYVIASTDYEGRPAEPSFHDSMGYYPGIELSKLSSTSASQYYLTKQWDASAAMPSTSPYSVKGPVSYPDYAATARLLWRLPDGWYYLTTGAANVGTGNPGDTYAQYGWHAEILSQTAVTATVRIWNAMQDFEGSVEQVSSTDPVVKGSIVDVTVHARNIGGAINSEIVLPLDPDTAYVLDSVWGGAVPLTAAAAAELAAEKGIEDLAAVAAGIDYHNIVGIGFRGGVGTGENVEFGFSVKAMSNTGMIHHSAAIFDESHFVQAIFSDYVEIVPAAEQVTDELKTIADAYIMPVRPDAKKANLMLHDQFGAWPYLYVGASDTLRSVAKFDLSGIDATYPVVTATLQVYVEGFSGGGSPADLAAYGITTPWDESTVTWAVPWQLEGGDFDPAIVDLVSISSADVGKWVTLDITPLVQDWVANPSTNNGVLVRLINPTSYTTFSIPSSEFWLDNLEPKIDVTYLVP